MALTMVPRLFSLGTEGMREGWGIYGSCRSFTGCNGPVVAVSAGTEHFTEVHLSTSGAASSAMVIVKVSMHVTTTDWHHGDTFSRGFVDCSIHS